jgi:hypothetical protein
MSDWLRDAFGVLRAGHNVIEKSPFGDVETDRSIKHTLAASEHTPAEQDINSMESVMPIARWKIMSLKSKHHFLDQFYTIRQKYRYEREADEYCAAQELQLYNCRKDGELRWSRLWDKSKSWQERLDACSKLATAHEHCVVTTAVR